MMELGAGYGQMARVFRELNPQCTYIIVDIPDTIVFSITYLLTNYPDAKYIIIDKKSGFDSISLRNFDFVFVVASFEECLSGQQIDLFINTHSLGEMPNKTISYYFDLIQSKLEVKGIWVLNRFLNRLKPESMNRINENISSVSLDRNWHVREWEFEPGFLKCPFFETIENQCLYIAASRLIIDSLSAESKAYKILSSVHDQDWYSFVSNFRPYEIPWQISQFSSLIFLQPERQPDFSMNGTLFDLWESFRLSQSRESAQAMVKYLRYINFIGPPFEEFYYYVNRM